jgi:S1-C subfamily serine protease
MRKLILLLLLIPFVCFGQKTDWNGYKYVELYKSDFNFERSSIEAIENVLKKKGFEVYYRGESLSNQIENKCLIVFLDPIFISETGWGGAATLEINFSNCNGDKVFSKRKKRGNASFYGSLFPRWSTNFVQNIKKLNFDSFYTPSIDLEKSNNKSDISNKDFNNNGVDIKSEQSIRDYLNNNGAELIEGIWEYSGNGDANYRLAILKNGYGFNGTILESSGRFQPGDIKVNFETAASEEILTIKWTMGDKRSIQKSVGIVKNNALIEFNLPSGKIMLYKIYPKLNKKTKNNKTGEWAGNGSGIIISKSGYIITNHHVIEDADDIEVEFILNDEVQKFNAEIVQVDKTNDLAILKIFDMNFDGVEDLPYNFKTRSSDVGTKVYAFGYPMALTVMGKEIKVTDGMISSKTGYDGNITTYQITAPIQGGNSGGPLFDEKGNLIGINSSGLRKDVADNVAYSIKTSYILNLIDILPKSIELPSSTKLEPLLLTEQIKEISKYVVLIKVK